MSTNLKVFLSVGRTSNDRQETFVKKMEEYLQANGLMPQTVGRTYFSSKQPLLAVSELMYECAGTVVLAYERVHLVDAIEKRGNPKEARLVEINLPTVWNQIEATMAYMVGHPLLVLVENDMKYEGLLETGNDWYVKAVNLEDNLLEDPEFIGMFSDWKRRVEAFHASLTEQTTKPSVPAGQVPKNMLIYLHQTLVNRFSSGELITLCFYLDVKYENLPGEEHQLKALNLLQELERTNRIDDLIKFGQQIRPDVDWQVS